MKKSESDLERELLARYRQWADLGYRASRFYQMFSPHCKRYVGGVAAVRLLLQKSGTPGFAFLKEKNKLKLSVEALVANGDWDDLFTASDRSRAMSKLGRLTQSG
jgi:hypothetical protein